MQNIQHIKAAELERELAHLLLIISKLETNVKNQKQYP